VILRRCFIYVGLRPSERRIIDLIHKNSHFNNFAIASFREGSFVLFFFRVRAIVALFLRVLPYQLFADPQDGKVVGDSSFSFRWGVLLGFCQHGSDFGGTCCWCCCVKQGIQTWNALSFLLSVVVLNRSEATDFKETECLPSPTEKDDGDEGADDNQRPRL
jgi:hypothetical protein